MMQIKNLPYLEKAFNEGYDIQQSYEEENHRVDYNLDFACQDIGLLSVNTGKIVACDPFVFAWDTKPFSYDFPVGDFLVQVSIGKFSYNDDERIALARIKFSEERPVSWEMALVENQNVRTLKEGEIFGYPVDAGTGCFMDVSAQLVLGKYLEKEENFYVLSEEMDKTYKHTRSWILWERGNENIAMFSSGEGDGHYPSYLGYDASGEICRLVTDFYLIFLS